MPTKIIQFNQLQIAKSYTVEDAIALLQSSSEAEVQAILDA
jgi:hypothetical protein